MIRVPLDPERPCPARISGRGFALIALIALLAGPVSAAGVYKWVDENGKVHYGDRPPEGPAKEMRVPAAAPATAPPTAAERRVKRRRLLDAFARERAEKKASAAKKRQAKLERRRDCARARDQLRQYREAAYMYDYDKSGDKVIYSRERRAEAMERYTRAVKRRCG